jgi:hypothetical protein
VVKVKGKAVPLHVMEALGGRGDIAEISSSHGGEYDVQSCLLGYTRSSYSFTTSALDGGEWSASRPGRAFTPGVRTPGTHCTGWAPEPVWTQRIEEKSFAPAGDRTPVARSSSP